MRTTSRLERGYETLLMGERLQLVIAARGRSDAAEVQRLLRTCPIVTYNSRDPAFPERLNCALELTKAVIAILEEISTKIAGMKATWETTSWLLAFAADAAELEAFRITGTVQTPIREAVESQRRKLVRPLRGARAALRAEGASTATAFSHFCADHVEVEPHAMLAAVSDTGGDLYDRFLKFDPDPAHVETLRSEFSEHWHAQIA